MAYSHDDITVLDSCTGSHSHQPTAAEQEAEMERAALQKHFLIVGGRRSRSGSALYTKELFNAILNNKDGHAHNIGDFLTAFTNSNNTDDDGALFEPEFQRVTILHPVEGKTSSEIFAHDDQLHSSEMLVDALSLRQRYMQHSGQSFLITTAHFLASLSNGKSVEKKPARREQKKSTEAYPHDHPVNGDPFHCEFLPKIGFRIGTEEGIYRVYDSNNQSRYPAVDRTTFIRDFSVVYRMICDGPLKSYCFRQLNYLQNKFHLHCNLNENRETAAQKSIPHRDFYNIRKVDTHIHASSCMNQKHLLRFIKKTMKTSPNDLVYVDPITNTPLTLEQVFQAMNLTTYDLSVDMLDVHADRNAFHRFDKFNAKYNPIGQSLLRDIFIRSDNYIGGKYFAQILKEVMFDLEESKYQNAELRLSIFGVSITEWDKLAEWAICNSVYSDNVKWLVQIPRLYDVYKANKIVDNFQTILDNVFRPLFEATEDPHSHPALHRFLQHVVGFDSVDDESKSEGIGFYVDSPLPANWNMADNPPYSYYLYYIYASMVVLNSFRRERGFNTFVLRPHCGEAGTVQHLVAGFLLAESISHGLLLRKTQKSKWRAERRKKVTSRGGIRWKIVLYGYKACVLQPEAFVPSAEAPENPWPYVEAPEKLQPSERTLETLWLFVKDLSNHWLPVDAHRYFRQPLEARGHPCKHQWPSHRSLTLLQIAM
ncbi:AMP deaminase 2 [Hypsibius exemplaris]|uniref:AMP deaminase 2 n=1 Tax=Hypsibius exemplaris TaxID=2072580 RepID=A0A1W0X8Q1_HYPEX|nr:AMP deaminase 2 [Hypsibius exemplaris]